MLQLTFFFCSVTSSHKVEFHLQTSCLPSLNSSMSLFSSNDLLCQRYVSIPPFVNTPLQRRWEREKGRRRWKKTSQFAATSVDTGPTSTNWIQCYDLWFQVLSEYFNSDADFNLLCSVFMIIFMVQGRDIEYKVVYTLEERWVSANFLGFNFGSPAFTSLGGELGGHPQLWGCVGHPADTHLHPQPQCGKVSRNKPSFHNF